MVNFSCRHELQFVVPAQAGPRPDSRLRGNAANEALAPSRALDYVLPAERAPSSAAPAVAPSSRRTLLAGGATLASTASRCCGPVRDMDLVPSSWWTLSGRMMWVMPDHTPQWAHLRAPAHREAWRACSIAQRAAHRARGNTQDARSVRSRRALWLSGSSRTPRSCSSYRRAHARRHERLTSTLQSGIYRALTEIGLTPMKLQTLFTPPCPKDSPRGRACGPSMAWLTALNAAVPSHQGATAASLPPAARI